MKTLPFKIAYLWSNRVPIRHLTLPETNIAPKNQWLEDVFPFGMAYFQVLFLEFQGGFLIFFCSFLKKQVLPTNPIISAAGHMERFPKQSDLGSPQCAIVSPRRSHASSHAEEKQLTSTIGACVLGPNRGLYLPHDSIYGTGESFSDKKNVDGFRSYQQTFQVPKTEVLTYISCM